MNKSQDKIMHMKNTDNGDQCENTFGIFSIIHFSSMYCGHVRSLIHSSLLYQECEK